MKVIRHRMCIPLLVVALLAGCSDTPAPLVGKWNVQDAKGYEFKGMFEFKADGTGTLNNELINDETNFVWEHLDGQTPEGYENAIQLSEVAEGKQKNQIKCGYKVDQDSVSFGGCKPLENLRFTRAPE